MKQTALTPAPHEHGPVSLEIKDLQLQAGGRILCNDISVSMQSNENWCVLGPNGVGKTTLLHTLAGLRKIDHGRLLLNDRDVEHYNPHELALLRGILFQRSEEPFPSSVLETVMSGRHPHIPRWGSECVDDLRLAEELLVRVGLADTQSRDISSLSGGEHQRVNIAAVLAQQTPLRLFDEPVSYLDLRHQTDMLDLITRDKGHLNILVLHDINHASRYCSHALLLFADGHSEHGTIHEMLAIDRLEALYDCRLKAIMDDGNQYFVST
jgi:iron complex transport system ATP-binding protein